MSPSRAITMSISVLIFAAGVAWTAPSGPDSPRARLAVWLRDHGYTSMALVVAPPDPASALPSEIIPTLP